MFASNLGFFMAFAGGLVSFLSPCILPVIPSYLSFIGGVAYGDTVSRQPSRRAVFTKTVFFVAGFSGVFVALGILFSGAGLLFAGAQTLVNRISGVVVVFFGLNILFDFWKVLDIERRFHLRQKPRGVLGSFLLGLAFGAGWTPCVGPILASILFLAGTSGTVARGAALLGAYSLGLGTPFLLAGAFFGFFSRQAVRLRSHMRAIKISSGIFIILLGVLIFLGSLSRLNAVLSDLAAALVSWRERSPEAPGRVFGSIFLALAVLAAALYAWRIRTGRPSARVAFPGHLAFLIVSVLLAVLSYTGAADFLSVLAAWLGFQGI
jgi:cytochrome c-type biogenesis protein